MEMSSAPTLPESSESERFPTLTCRPRAAVSSDSSLGRNAFASMKKGIAMTRRMSTPTTMATIFTVRFMILTSCQNGIRRFDLRRELLPASVSLRVLQ